MSTKSLLVELWPSPGTSDGPSCRSCRQPVSQHVSSLPESGERGEEWGVALTPCLSLHLPARTAVTRTRTPTRLDARPLHPSRPRRATAVPVGQLWRRASRPREHS